MPSSRLWSGLIRPGRCAEGPLSESAGLSAGGVPGRCRDWSEICARPLMLHGLPSQVRNARAVLASLGMP